MAITLQELKKLTREEQKKALEKLTTQDFVKLVGSLIEEAKQNKIQVGVLPNLLKTISITRDADEDVDDKKVKVGDKRSRSNDDDDDEPELEPKKHKSNEDAQVDQSKLRKQTIIQQALNVLDKLGKQASKDERLAIDREFEDTKAKMDAVIADISSGRMPKFMYHRILELNFFDEDEQKSRTFLAYAAPKLKNFSHFSHFLAFLKGQLGDKWFASYLATPNYLGRQSEDDKEVKQADIFDLYLKDLGVLNRSEREALSAENKTRLSNFVPRENARAVAQVQNVDTHQISTHKSADESHVSAFKMMAEAEKLGITATYTAPVKATDPSREVSITEKGRLDEFVAGKNVELKAQIDELVGLDDAGIYNKYVRHTDIEKFKTIEYKDLVPEEQEKFAEKIKAFRFQALTAKRFMDEMTSQHSCGVAQGSAYHYRTDSKASCGLTMEQMVATAYWASKNKENFKEGVGATEVGNFILLVKQIYDMRRGYDIDHGTDKPDENKFPEVLGKDNNRCHGGGVNSLSWGLKTSHKAYNPVVILRTDIEREIANIYKNIVNNNLELIKGQEEVIRIWNASGKVTGVVREELKKQFEEKHQKEFVDYYKGYIADDAFYNVIENALDNIPLPEQFKRKSELEDMSLQEIYQAMKNEKLPLLHSDKERGIEPTLTYLSSLAGKEDIIKDLVNRATSEKGTEPSVQKAIHFLSRSQIPQKLKDVEIISIKGKSITIGDVADLKPEELAGLFSIEPEEMLEESARKKMYNLFFLYVKKVGLTEEELNKGFGYDRGTPLHLATGMGLTEIVKLFIEKGANPNAKDKNGNTPLHWAAGTGKTEIVKELLKHKDIDLNTQDIYGFTALYRAVTNNHTEVVELFIEKGVDIKAKFPYMLNETALHRAAGNGNTKLVKLLLEKGADINVQDSEGSTPLHWAAREGRTDVLKELLKHKDIDLNAKNKDGKTAADLVKTPEIRQLIEDHIKAKAEQARALAAIETAEPQTATSSTAMPAPPASVQVDSSAAQLQQTSRGNGQNPSKPTSR